MWRIWLLASTVSVALLLPPVLKADDEPENKPSPPAVPSVPKGDDEPENRPTEGRRRGQLSDAQKALRKEMLAKYDKNKNGQIDPEERLAITPEDQERLARAGLTVSPRRRRPDAK